MDDFKQRKTKKANARRNKDLHGTYSAKHIRIHDEQMRRKPIKCTDNKTDNKSHKAKSQS